MGQRFPQQTRGLSLFFGQVGADLRQFADFAGGRVQPVLMLQLPREFFGEQRSCVGDETLQPIAGGLVKGHESRSIVGESKMGSLF